VAGATDQASGAGGNDGADGKDDADGQDGADEAELSARLAAAGCVAPDEEAHELMAAAHDPHELEALVLRREDGEPLAWLTGGVSFCGQWIHVDEGVYVPRWQSEEMAVAAGQRLLLQGRGALAVDLCTGAGAVACHLQRASPSSSVLGVELDRRAARCAARNGVVVLIGNLGDALATGCAALVTAVAPYVPSEQLRFLPSDVLRFEPREALDGGLDGLVIIRAVIESATRLLAAGGELFVELGGDQGASARGSLLEAGFHQIELHADDEGDLRWLQATKR
jgi:release factor glutamine methyltransferase